jgi:hypothetical protein
MCSIFRDSFVGSASMFEANKLLKTKVKSLSLELVKSLFNWNAIRTTLLDLLQTILSSDATVAAHCILALAAIVSFSLRLKQQLRESVNDSASVQFLVANLFTIGCAGDDDPGDILHSIGSAGLEINCWFRQALIFSDVSLSS